MQDEIGDDELVPLSKAAQIFFHGYLTKSSLKTEAAKGNLEIFRIANKDFVTRNGIKRMIERCRKPSCHSASEPDRPAGVSSYAALKQVLGERSDVRSEISSKEATRARLRKLKEEFSEKKN